MNIQEILQNINKFYNTNVTKDVDFRIKQLKILKSAIKKYEPQIYKALKDDLRKPDFEIVTTEIGIVMQELDYAIRHVKRWAAPTRVSQPFFIPKSKGRIMKDPYGVVLIIGPFNYPFQLLLAPLIGAIAAGNCAVVKPTKNTPATAKVIHKMLEETFRPDYIKPLEASEYPSSELVSAEFDYIFFTGSTEIGKEVAVAASKNLVPFTLELGGKSPTIVDKTANLEIAAKRIAWGKFLNSGQTCIAPDYIFVEEEIKDKLIEELQKAIRLFFGTVVQESPDFGRIINTKEFHRLKNIVEREMPNIITGGQTDECGLYIEPTLVNATDASPTMQEEVFGPILPILTYKNIDDVIDFIRKRSKPLGLYVFSEDEELVQLVLTSLSFGGGCVNDTINHLLSSKMPFGGVGLSGIGQYHGKYTFDTFTHEKSILYRDGNIEPGLIFPPYNEKVTNMVKRLFK